MLICHAFNPKDFARSVDLFKWCTDLDGPQTRHKCLLIASALMTPEDMQQVNAAARLAFPETTMIKQSIPEETSKYRAANALFRVAATYVCDKLKEPFIWVEGDATPLKAGWLDILDQEYKRCLRPFLGAKFDWISLTAKLPHLNGNCIYPFQIQRYNPFMLHATERPWDTVRPDLTLKHAHITNLINHDYGNIATDEACTFPDQSSLARIPKEAVLFHRCKDGSLIQRLREQRGQEKPVVVKKKATGWKGFFGLSSEPKYHVSVRRSGAFGDALAATCVAAKLAEKNVAVKFQTSTAVQQLLKYVPNLKLANVNGKVDVNLDGAYEGRSDRAYQHFAKIFVEETNRQLPREIPPIQPFNIAPTLEVPERIKRRFIKRFKDVPRPWIGICPRSNSFNVRTVPDATWERVAANVNGSCFWLGNHALPPENIIHFTNEDITNVLFATACMDLVVSVDTGPLHIATALGVPAIAIEQSSSPEIHLSDQRDWSSIAPPGLGCLNCQKEICPVNAEDPPCQYIPYQDIVTAVNRRFTGLASDDVTGIVVIHRPPAARLNLCLNHLLPQVSEVIVCACGASRIPQGALQHPKIRYITSRQTDIGYGRKLNFAVRHTVTPWIVDLNDDVFLDEGAVKEMLRVLKSNDKIAKVGLLMYYPGRKTIQHGGGRRGPGDLGWGHADHRQSTPSIKEVTEVEFCTGACHMMRREAFYDVGGMDERYKLYYDDTDFCLKVRQKGWKIFYTPHATAIHDEHSSTGVVPAPVMAAEVQKSKAVFKEKWEEYFQHNANLNGIAPQLGNFNY